MVRQPLVARFPSALAALALSAATTACATSGAVPRPFPTTQGSTPIERPEGSQGSLGSFEPEALVGMALSFRGVPYRNGGANPSGFDCSGFTQYVYSHHGIGLPREVREQFQQGRSVTEAEVAAGDLLFFTTTGPGPTHVAIAVGGGQFVHAPSSTGVVRVERLGTAYWSVRYLGARRLTPANSQSTSRD